MIILYSHELFPVWIGQNATFLEQLNVSDRLLMVAKFGVSYKFVKWRHTIL